jgi:hypothetical protein
MLPSYYRSTIYWNANLVTGIEWEVKFNYYNASAPGTYRIVIEGMDLDGNIGRKVIFYNVE